MGRKNITGTQYVWRGKIVKMGETSSLGRRGYVFTDPEIKRVTRIAE